MEPFGPIYPAGLDDHKAPAHPGSTPPICPLLEWLLCGSGEVPANGYGSCWLTCLVTPGNGCLSEVLDFLVLLQKALQKPGSFLNRNAKASSKPLLPCISRNAKVRSGPHSHPAGCMEVAGSGRQRGVGDSVS